jgi:hypothetical protein
VAIPLKLLNFTPEENATYQFNIGLLRGNGAQTLQRVYWKNQAAGIVSDIPSEAELIPALWGQLHINPTFAIRGDLGPESLSLRSFCQKVFTTGAGVVISGGGWAGSSRPS